MTWLKAYAWEHERFPWHQRVRIKPELAPLLVAGLARQFKVTAWAQNTLRRDGGHAYTSGKIEFCSRGVSLGVVFHEMAHVVNRQLYGGTGHTGTFRRALLKVYCETNRQEVKRLLLDVLSAHGQSLKRQRAESERAMRQAQRRAADKAFRKTREYKMQVLRERIKRLTSRQKRIATLLASAQRSLRAYERSVKAVQEVAA